MTNFKKGGLDRPPFNKRKPKNKFRIGEKVLKKSNYQYPDNEITIDKMIFRGVEYEYISKNGVLYNESELKKC